MISGIITTFNEEDNIEAVIDTMSWLDEIIVVDSFSTDNTLMLAEKKGVNIVQRKYDSPSAQKNWAIPQAKYPWVFLLDADERCTEKLKSEIQNLIANDTPCDAYWIKRKNRFMGKEIKFSGWQDDKVIRFFKRDTCKYDDKWVHEEIETSGKIGQLNSYILHNTYKDREHYEQKMERYANYAVHDLKKKVNSVNFFHLYIKPAARFFKHYILQLGILDGKVGLIISKMSAKSVQMKYQKLKDHLNQEA